MALTKIKGNIWEYGTGMNGSTSDKYAFEHPAMFPEQLAADHILSWSNPDDLLWDPFGGSGTTAKMAIKLGRRVVTCDISEEYCAIAKRRIVDALAQLPLLEAVG